MPWPPQQRISPSGPFAPAGGDLDGFVRRIFFARGPAANTDIPEGTTPPGVTLLDIPVILTADDDLPNLRWVAEAVVTYVVEGDNAEDPRMFSLSTCFGLQAAGAGVPTPVDVRESGGWPYYIDDDNGQPVNKGVMLYAWDLAHYPWAVGMNHVTLGVCFFGGGAHRGIVAQNGASLIVREYRGPSLTVLP